MTATGLSAHELYKAGELESAIDALARELQNNPGDGAAREFLVALLCFAGEYDRAEKQLDILASLHPNMTMGALLYRSALHADRTRHEMFVNENFPSMETVREVCGTLNGKRFNKLSDADARIGSRLELYAAGQYTWMPFEQIGSVRMSQPSYIHDLLWAPATVEARDGTDLGEVLLPVIAPLSNQDEDDLVRLGRVTEWYGSNDGTEIPSGLKMLIVDGQEFPFLEVREIVFELDET